MLSRYGRMLLLAGIVLGELWGLIQAVVYFRANSGNLMYVAAVALAGGLIVALLYQLQPRDRSTVKVLFWGSLTIVQLAVLMVFVASVVKMFVASPFPVEVTLDIVATVLGTVAVMALLTLFAWREFTAALTTGQRARGSKNP